MIVIYYPCLFLICLLVSYLICKFIHELGHAYSVICTDQELLEARLGGGKKKDNFLVWKLKEDKEEEHGYFKIKKKFWTRGSRCVWDFKKWDKFRKHGILISLGGCIANGITFLLTLPLILIFKYLSIDLLYLFFHTLNICSLYQLISNLLPFEGHDGKAVLGYWKKSKEDLQKEHYEGRRRLEQNE